MVQANLRVVQTGQPDPGPLTFEGLYQRYSSYVAGVATRLLGREADVDDAVQNVFCEVLDGLSTLRDPAAVKPWLATLTVRVVRSKLRRRRVRTFIGLDEATDYAELTLPGTSAETAVLLGRVYRVLDELPVNERIAWSLRYVEGEQLEGVAAACGCSLATAKRRIAAAQSVIQKVVLDE